MRKWSYNDFNIAWIEVRTGEIGQVEVDALGGRVGRLAIVRGAP